jgi:PIN domain nuclease of toxin-antitoxin system
MIVLDTHTVIWLAEWPELLSAKAKDTITSARQQDGVAIADKTLWELAMLISKKRVSVRTSLLDFLQEVERNFTVLPVTSLIADRAVQFSDRYPIDPADRLIGATAIVHGFALVTKDRDIRASGEVNCIW